ncbi:MAG: 3-oxoacyl-[acyl-carrier-protein] reductase [Desulfobacteraceae bacterium]
MSDDKRVVVVTGGSKGIGRAVAHRFAKEGARLFLVHYDQDDKAVQDALAEVSAAGGTAEARRLDVSSASDVEEFFNGVLGRFGRVDVLINNAGMTRDTLLIRMKEEDWDAVLAVNLKGVFNCTKAVIQSMLKQRSGRIVNISSVTGAIGNVGQANYAASKAGILGFTKTVAREAAPRGVTVNAVAPGFIDTEMTASLPQKVKDSFLQQIPLGKMGRPEDVAEAVYWLCSEGAAYITGQTIHVNGGMFM